MVSGFTSYPVERVASKSVSFVLCEAIRTNGAMVYEGPCFIVVAL